VIAALQSPDVQIVLASASTARARILQDAGLAVTVRPAPIDEAAVKDAIRAGSGDMAAGDVAAILAQAKAVSASEADPTALVVGADQILSLDDRIFDKPSSMDEARETLVVLRGRTHLLHTAIACARGGEVIWHHQCDASLTMRDFSNEFLGRYLAAAGETVLASVGAYRLEGPGAHLFSKVDGDYFTILGLPLLPLLEYLRTERILVT
jgi:septum formation protein